MVKPDIVEYSTVCNSMFKNQTTYYRRTSCFTVSLDLRLPKWDILVDEVERLLIEKALG